MTINAFSKDYVKTYMPNFLTSIQKEEAQRVNGQKYGSLARENKPKTTDAPKDISVFPKVKRVSLEVTNFHIYSRAGTK